jgi:uncharacterized MAPEG superfamily protein
VTTPFWCLAAAAIAPYILAGIGGYLRVQQLGSLDPHHPRVQALELRDSAARALAAQENAWEALTIFGVAVIVAHLAGADPGWSATASLLFVAARVVHAAAYLGNVAPLRSLAFLVGLLCCVWLFALAGMA